MNAPHLKRLWQKFERSRVGRSVFRVGLPHSNLERSQAMVSSFLLHVQPAKVHKHSLKPGYTLGLGLISLYLNTGSARKPTIRVRLAPIGPYGFAVSTAASVLKKPPSARTNPPPSMSPMNAKNNG